jgi:predicted DNA-binding transcriptional regulator AlpA
VTVTIPDSATDRLWTPEEVSAFLGGVPVATLYQWRYKGIGPKGRRVGRHLRYKPSDVRAWIERQD